MTATLPTITSSNTTTDLPQVTVLICTRDRGDLIHATIRSVLANTYPRFDLLIVDQSSEISTARAVAEFCGDSRLRYIHTATQGLSIARNIGLAFCHSDLVLMTDDDCEVPPDWISEMVALFSALLNLGLSSLMWLLGRMTLMLVLFRSASVGTIC